MNTSRLDYLNIGLMIVSFALAVKLPFHLFLMSYAILGPLHYLTEIGWLDKRNYYATHKKDAWILVGLCAMMTFGFAYSQFDQFAFSKTWTASIEASVFAPISQFLRDYQRGFVFLAFYSAVMMTFVKKKSLRYGLMLPGLVAAYFLHDVEAYIVIIGVMLPTVIHVYLFTGAFILYGALKNKSTSGYLSLIVFLMILFLIVFQHPHPKDYQLTEYWRDNMEVSKFHIINFIIAKFFHWANETNYSVMSPLGLKLHIFLAFAYTYHYLNWFSKTKVINWHHVPRKRLVSAFAIWFASVALYFYDYKLGLAALFFLSVLHVFLEFPLNHLTFVGIVKEIRARFRSKNE